MKILVTGMSGVGKSTLCNYIKQLGHNSFDLDDIPGLCKLCHPDGKEVPDLKQHTNLNMLETDYVCNIDTLQKHMSDQSGTVYYFGYVDNVDEVAACFDKIILLTVNPDENKRRMTTRTANDFAKHEKTQNELMSFKDTWEKSVNAHNAIIIDASGNISEVAQSILRV